MAVCIFSVGSVRQGGGDWRDVSGTAAEVGDQAAAAHVFCKPIEKMAVERLACQLGREMLPVGLGR
jgi:hypothetical protein